MQQRARALPSSSFPGTSYGYHIGPRGQVVDTNGNPCIDPKTGEPMAVNLDANGNLSIDSMTGKPMITGGGGMVSTSAGGRESGSPLANGQVVDANSQVVDANGNRYIDLKTGKPMIGIDP